MGGTLPTAQVLQDKQAHPTLCAGACYTGTHRVLLSTCAHCRTVTTSHPKAGTEFSDQALPGCLLTQPILSPLVCLTRLLFVCAQHGVVRSWLSHQYHPSGFRAHTCPVLPLAATLTWHSLQLETGPARGRYLQLHNACMPAATGWRPAHRLLVHRAPGTFATGPSLQTPCDTCLL